MHARPGARADLHVLVCLRDALGKLDIELCVFSLPAQFYAVGGSVSLGGIGKPWDWSCCARDARRFE